MGDSFESSATPFSQRRVTEALTAEWDSIAELATSFDEPTWKLPTRCPGWSVQDTISHIIGTESMLAGRKQPDAVDNDAPHLRNDIGRFNEAWVAERRSRSGSEVLAEFRSITAERLSMLGAMTESQFEEEAWTPAGLATYGRFMQIRIFDSWMHEQDIRAAVGVPGHVHGPAVEFALAEISTALGYVVGKLAKAPTGSSVAFLIGTAPRHRFDVVVEDRAHLSSTPVLSPTVTLTTDLATFAALIGGRETGQAALGRDEVSLSGDPELGERLVNNLAFVI